MSFKTIFTVISNPETAQTALAPASAFCRANDAHVDVLSLGIDHNHTGYYYYAGADVGYLQETLTKAQQASEAGEKAVAKVLSADGVRFGTSHAIAQNGDVARPVASYARFSDLAILNKPYGPDAQAVDESILEAVLFEGSTPVLVCPQDHTLPETFNTVLLAWNNSPEALRAIRAALPLLRKAQSVRIVVIDPPRHGPDRTDPGGPLAMMLSRHGVSCDIDVLNKSLPRVSDVLLRHSMDKEADLIVMGAYGHSRLIEAILGGATRNTLQDAQVPVFMAH